MARFKYDRSSKWLIEHHGDSILRLAGVQDKAWRASQPEVVQPRKLPDGLLEILRVGQTAWQPVIVEIESYPDRSTADDVMDDLMLVYQDRRVLPEVLVLVLHPKGTAEIASERIITSESGWTEVRGRWRVVNLWTLSAADLLATSDPGLMP